MPVHRAGLWLVAALLYAAPASAQFWILSHEYSNGLLGPAHPAQPRDGREQVTEADAYLQAGEECVTYPEVVAVTIIPGGGEAKVHSCEELIEMLGKDPSSRAVEPSAAPMTASDPAEPPALRPDN